MKAVLSGRACVALLIDGETLNSIHYEEMDRLVPRQPEEFRFLFGGVNDLDWIDDVASVDDVRDRLADAVDSTEALNLVLYLCDDRLSEETLQSAAMELEELIVDPEIVAELECVMFAKPLPKSVDLAAGLTACDVTDSNETAAFLERLLDRQPAITTVRMAWHAIPIERFEHAEQTMSEAVCLRRGLFRDLVNELDDTGAVVTTQLLSATNKRLRRKLPIVIGLLNSWSQAIIGTSTRREQAAETPRADDEDAAAQNGGQKRRRSVDRAKVLEKIQLQKRWIIEALKQRDLDRARQLVDELCSFQSQNSSYAQTCQSLCDLAMQSQDLGQYEFQHQLTHCCIQLKPDDTWSWAQHGKALLNLGRFDPALHAYDQAKDFSKRADDNAVARNGRAEVLKAQGDLPASLAAYDAVLIDHPTNVVTRNGRAEVLKAQGNLPAALAAYDAVLIDHPTDVVARNGRAQILLLMNHCEEALGDLPACRPSTANDWIGYHIRGMVLLRLENVEASVQVFEEGVEHCPFAAHADYFRTALSVVRLQQQRFGDALNVLAKISSREMEAPANVLRLHIYGELHNFTEATAVSQRLPSPRNSSDAETFAELRRRYVNQQRPAHDDRWLIDAEVRYLLQSA